jgi:low temperature requirement protein LtrA
MVAILIMAVALPEAFGQRGLVFSAAFVAMQVGRTAFAVFATNQDPGLHRNFQRVLAWRSASALLWLAGGLASEPPRTIFWVAAVAMDSLGPPSDSSLPVWAAPSRATGISAPSIWPSAASSS